MARPQSPASILAQPTVSSAKPGRYNADMRLVLKLHPDSPSAAAAQVEANVARSSSGSLLLSYVVTGKIDELRLPPVAAATRADELWRHTCFEAFVGASGPTYYEFNFAPSTQWAVYRFTGYRSGMRAATEIAPPRIEVRSAPERYSLQASLQLDRLPDVPRDAAWRFGLAAVIEEMSGRKSYWALAHPSGKPDFHHPDCFGHQFSRP